MLRLSGGFTDPATVPGVHVVATFFMERACAVDIDGGRSEPNHVVQLLKSRDLISNDVCVRWRQLEQNRLGVIDKGLTTVHSDGAVGVGGQGEHISSIADIWYTLRNSKLSGVHKSAVKHIDPFLTVSLVHLASIILPAQPRAVSPLSTCLQAQTFALATTSFCCAATLPPASTCISHIT